MLQHAATQPTAYMSLTKVGRELVILLWNEMETVPSECQVWSGMVGFLSPSLFYSPKFGETQLIRFCYGWNSPIHSINSGAATH